MLITSEIEKAVILQQKSYQLLKWVADSIRRGIIDFTSAHRFSDLPSAAFEWMVQHYENLPAGARSSQEDLPQFAAFFSTYLLNSFELVQDPGKRLYSPNAHCFCPICSWLVDAPNLVTRKVTTSDKARAQKMKMRAVSHLLNNPQIDLLRIASLEDDQEQKECVCLVTYGYDLLDRMKGVTNGPSVLALWRGFAWTAQGSPKKGFMLTADKIMNAQSVILAPTLSHKKR